MGGTQPAAAIISALALTLQQRAVAAAKLIKVGRQCCSVHWQHLVSVCLSLLLAQPGKPARGNVLDMGPSLGRAAPQTGPPSVYASSQDFCGHQVASTAMPLQEAARDLARAEEEEEASEALLEEGAAPSSGEQLAQAQSSLMQVRAPCYRVLRHGLWPTAVG